MNEEEIDYKKLFETKKAENLTCQAAIDLMKRDLDIERAKRKHLEAERDAYYALVEMMVQKLVER